MDSLNTFFNGLVKVVTAIIVVAIIAAIVSKKSTTTSVIQSGSSAFASLLQTILKPISSTPNFSIGISNIVDQPN